MIRTISAALAHKRSALGQREKGFTLIELLVVVIIIGILAAIAIPVFLGQQASAKGSAVESAITNAKVNVVSGIVSGTAPVAGTVPSGNDKVVLTLSIPSGGGFCIQGTHTEVTGKTWSALDTTGVRNTGC